MISTLVKSVHFGVVIQFSGLLICLLFPTLASANLRDVAKIISVFQTGAVVDCSKAKDEISKLVCESFSYSVKGECNKAESPVVRDLCEGIQTGIGSTSCATQENSGKFLQSVACNCIKNGPLRIPDILNKAKGLIPEDQKASTQWLALETFCEGYRLFKQRGFFENRFNAHCRPSVLGHTPSQLWSMIADINAVVDRTNRVVFKDKQAFIEKSFGSAKPKALSTDELYEYLICIENNKEGWKESCSNFAYHYQFFNTNSWPQRLDASFVENIQKSECRRPGGAFLNIDLVPALLQDSSGKQIPSCDIYVEFPEKKGPAGSFLVPSDIYHVNGKSPFERFKVLRAKAGQSVTNAKDRKIIRLIQSLPPEQSIGLPKYIVADPLRIIMERFNLDLFLFQNTSEQANEAFQKFFKQTYLEIGSQLNKALATLHRNGIVHYDLKPENQLVRKESDGLYFFALTDFNLSRNLKEDCEEWKKQNPTGNFIRERIGTRDFFAIRRFNPDYGTRDCEEVKKMGETEEVASHASVLLIYKRGLRHVPWYKSCSHLYKREDLAPFVNCLKVEFPKTLTELRQGDSIDQVLARALDVDAGGLSAEEITREWERAKATPLERASPAPKDKETSEAGTKRKGEDIPPN